MPAAAEIVLRFGLYFSKYLRRRTVRIKVFR